MTQTQATPAGLPREYETIYLLRPTVEADVAQRIATRVEEVVAREQGKLTSVESWGRRRLAYAIQGQRRGVYVYLRYIGRGPLVNELERNLRLQDDVMRFLTVQVREDVDVATVQIDPAAVKFEPVTGPTPEEELEDSRERSLGLDGPPPGYSRDRDDRDDDDMDDGGDDEGPAGEPAAEDES